MNKGVSGPSHNPSVATRLFINFVEWTTGLTSRMAWAATLIAFAATTTIDFAARGSFNPHLPFFVATFLAAWTISELAGMLCAAAATTVITIIHGSAYGLQTTHPDLLASTANGVGRLLMLSWFALLASALRTVVERERWRANVDGLTGALNKAALREQMVGVVDLARRSDRALVLAYVDLDGFKAVNDGWGHSAGDRVLTSFASGAREAIRSYDLLARIGGDEFILVLTARDCNEGDRVAEMLHVRLTKVLEATGFPVTCSMGALVIKASAVRDNQCLIEAADLLMYEVKRSGKNALRIARAGGLEPLARPPHPRREDPPCEQLFRPAAAPAMVRRQAA